MSMAQGFSGFLPGFLPLFGNRWREKIAFPENGLKRCNQTISRKFREFGKSHRGGRSGGDEGPGGESGAVHGAIISLARAGPYYGHLRQGGGAWRGAGSFRRQGLFLL